MEKIYVKKSRAREIVKDLGGNTSDLEMIEGIFSAIYKDTEFILIDDEVLSDNTKVI